MKSFCWIPLLWRYLAAGDVLEIFPAGLIWSVVIESPNDAKTYAEVISLILGKSSWVEEKKGGLCIYVDESFQVYCSDWVTFNPFHLSFPFEIRPYTYLNIYGLNVSI